MRTAVQTTTAETETTLELYLRRIIETQPVCLSRVASDGTFLAVNEAALSLLGAEQLEQVLDTSLLTLIASEDKEQCRSFLGRIINGDRGSIEVDLTGLHGLRHTLEIHAVALPGSPDGLSAAFCAFRDITEYSRLERALMDAAAREEQQASALAAERQRLEAALAETRDATAATASATERARAAALEAALADADSRHRDASEQHASRQAQLLADFETAQQNFETSLTEQLGRIAELEAALRDTEARERALAERYESEAGTWKVALAQATAEHELQSGALRQSMATLEASLAEVTAREQAYARTRQEEEARWQATLNEALSAREAEISALRQAIAGTEQAARDAEAGRDEVVARYDADRTAWNADRESLEARAAAERTAAEAAAAELRQQVEALEAMQSDRAAQTAALESAAAQAEAARARLAVQLAGAAAERQAVEAEIRGLSRSARSGRLALALSADLEETLARAIDRGRGLLGSLAADSPDRPAVEQWLAATCQAESTARRIRRESRPAGGTAAAGDVIRSLEPTLGALLSPDIALSVLVGSPDARVDISADQLEQLVLTLVAHRRTTMIGGGHASIEVADVEIDEECGRERGASPGPYVLVALHVAGEGVEAGLPDALVGVPAGADTWRGAGPGLAGVVQLAQSAGGHAWATREGPGAVAFEIYLPRVEAPPDEVTR